MSFDFEKNFVDSVEAEISDSLADAIARATDRSVSVEDRIDDALLAMRQLRAFLHLARPAFAYYRTLNVSLRDASHRLSYQRDATLRGRLLREIIKNADHQTGLDAFSDRIEELAGQVPTQAEQEDMLTAFSRELAALAASRAILRVVPQDRKCLADGAIKTYRTARRAMARASITQAQADLREWGKHTKYHAHHLVVFSALPNGPSQRRCKSVAQLGDLLDRHRDTDALVAHLHTDSLLSGSDLKKIHKAVEPLQAGLLRAAFRLGLVKFKRQPGEFRRKIRKGLKAVSQAA